MYYSFSVISFLRGKIANTKNEQPTIIPGIIVTIITRSASFVIARTKLHTDIMRVIIPANIGNITYMIKLLFM